MAKISSDELLDLIQEQCTLARVRAFLKAERKTSSASSWEKMREDRLKPLIENDAISHTDIAELISDSEEHSNKHVFLYRFSGAPEALSVHFDANEIEAKIASSSGLPPLGHSQLSILPANPEVTSVRLDDGQFGKRLIVKITKKLERKKPGEYQYIEGEKTWVAEIEEYRAVDVLCLHEDGLLEVRLHTHAGAIDYNGVAAAAFSTARPLLRLLDFSELALGRVRDYFVDPLKRNEVAERYEIAEADVANAVGEGLIPHLRRGRGGILQSQSLLESLDQFRGVQDTDPYCHRVRYVPLETLSRKVSVIVTEQINEIILSANLSREEYDKIISDVLRIERETR